MCTLVHEHQISLTRSIQQPPMEGFLGVLQVSAKHTSISIAFASASKKIIRKLPSLKLKVDPDFQMPPKKKVHP